LGLVLIMANNHVNRALAKTGQMSDEFALKKAILPAKIQIIYG